MLTWVKRESGYGASPVITGPAAANDKPTLDMLTSLNARGKRIWRKADWKWQIETLSIPMVVGQDAYSVTTKSGNKIDRIFNIVPYDLTVNPSVAEDPLLQLSERRFYEKAKEYSSGLSNGSQPNTGVPRWYMNQGQVNGLWQIRVLPAPSSVFTMTGSGKAIRNTWIIGDVTGVAPFSPGNTGNIINPPLDYFPDGVVEDILFEGMMADAYLIQNKPDEASRHDQAFEAKLKLLAAEEAYAFEDNSPITPRMPEVRRRRLASSRRR